VKQHDRERPAPAPRLKEFADEARQMPLEQLRELELSLPETRGLAGSTGVFLGLLEALALLPNGSEAAKRVRERAVAAAVHVVVDRAGLQMSLYESPAREYWEAFEVVREATLQGRVRSSSIDEILWEIEESKNEPPPLGDCGTIWVV
jgi:hypothetical protein